MKLCKQFFGFENDTFLVYVYIAPSNSSYVLRNVFRYKGDFGNGFK
jgi:hypothetical protein